MALGGIPTHLQFKPPNLLHHKFLHTHHQIISFNKTTLTTNHYFQQRNHFYPILDSLSTKACSDAADFYPTPQHSSASDIDEQKRTLSTGDGYVDLFVRMLGLDNDPLDREQAVVAIWKYCLGGKQNVDTIMQFHGAVNLTVNLLKSDSDASCEAAAGLLRTISAVNRYRDSVVASGAIEEITGLLRRSSLSSNVKEQSLGTLWNLSADENLRLKMANSDLLPLLLKLLEDEDMKVKEAAGGVLATLSLSHSNHNIMVEAGIVPKLARVLTTDAEGSNIIKKEARNALLELAKDDYNKILIMEEGLLVVPLVGSAAYSSFKPSLYSWPSLPDGTKIEQSPKGPSRYGASELLLGLNIEDNADLEEIKINAVVGRSQQQFLARIGAIEKEDDECQSFRFTLLPTRDGIARLVLILGLEDDLAVSRAAESIGTACINEYMRVSFKEAGAVKLLVQLIDHPRDVVRFAALQALERLSVSNNVCQIIQAGVLYPLINLLKQSDPSGNMTEVILNILTRILDPAKEMRSKFYIAPVTGSKNGSSATLESSSGTGHQKAISQSISSETIDMGGLLDSAVLGRFVDILKISSPNLQKKAAAVLEFCVDIDFLRERVVSTGIEAGLKSVFEQKAINEAESENEDHMPELHPLEVEEAGYAISAASRLLTRLLDYEVKIVNVGQLSQLLRKILKSNVPLESKNWVAACLVKLRSMYGHNLELETQIDAEVTIYETIPSLLEQMKNSYDSPEVQEAAVLELNRIISEGLEIDPIRDIAAKGVIFPLVKVIETGTDRSIEAGLAILYNLSMDPENHAAMIAAGAVPALRKIVLCQRSSWSWALHLLRTLPT